jgi:hypothetical protein
LNTLCNIEGLASTLQWRSQDYQPDEGIPIMKTILAALAVAALLGAGAAQAADPFDRNSEAYDGPTQATRNWTGLWVGAFGGYQINTNELNYSDHLEGGKDEETWSNDRTAVIDGLGSQGFMGELGIGFDKQLNRNLLIGVLAGFNIDDSQFKARIASENTPGGLQNSAEASFEKEWGGVLGGRIGLIHGQTLFSVGGGWAFGKIGAVKGKPSEGELSESGNLFKGQETDLSGWFVQGDIEHRIDGGLYATVTGRYTNYGSINLAGEDYETDCPPGAGHASLDLNRDELAAMVGLKYKIGVGDYLGF